MSELVLEFRSDTFTLPTKEMRRAMAEAEVGDDQYAEDPTANRLEERAADLLGKEAAVFVPTGMMGNLCGILAQAERGDCIVLGDLAHIYQNEAGAYAVVGGLSARTVPNRDGCPASADVEAALGARSGRIAPRVAVVCLENSHNYCGGTVITAAQTAEIAAVSHSAGAKVHLDGARLFNASVALGVEARELVAAVDTAQFCFSKGLSAPVGSALVGTHETIAKARYVRKQLGGAMTQVGVLAAAALVALETMRDRLGEDHEHARNLAEGLATIRGVHVEREKVTTNIVAFEVEPPITAAAFVQACASRGLRLSRYAGGPGRLRMLTHRNVDQRHVDASLVIIARVVAELRMSIRTSG